MSQTTRRSFIKIGLASAALSPLAYAADAADSTPAHTLPALPYPATALEPHIDELTMNIHHGKHHAAYVAKLNEALASHKDLAKLSLHDLQGKISTITDPAAQSAIRNNGGGHWNHSFFWNIMSAPKDAGKPSAALLDAITSAFGSMEAMKTAFADAAMKRFGSGWAWVVVQDGKLKIVSTANQDNPTMKGIVDEKDLGQPILALDVWEHAYYLHYQNKRADYVTAWWSVVNWTAVNKHFSA